MFLSSLSQFNLSFISIFSWTSIDIVLFCVNFSLFFSPCFDYFSILSQLYFNSLSISSKSGLIFYFILSVFLNFISNYLLLFFFFILISRFSWFFSNFCVNFASVLSEFALVFLCLISISSRLSPFYLTFSYSNFISDFLKFVVDFVFSVILFCLISIFTFFIFVLIFLQFLFKFLIKFALILSPFAFIPNFYQFCFISLTILSEFLYVRTTESPISINSASFDYIFFQFVSILSQICLNFMLVFSHFSLNFVSKFRRFRLISSQFSRLPI